jgi:alkanesulfonate monooxygenase SsuD/methylene tetrahydromethanopterin reductase-like flavin-dependent oxidoreductase (luciferase family)
MTHLFGPRIIAGFGAGTFDHEFAAIGVSKDVFRPDLVRSNALIFRQVFGNGIVNYKDDYYAFNNVDLHPKPTGPIPFWYCGATPASARLAVEYADGWMPGRTTLRTVVKRVETMKELSAQAGRPVPTVAIIPPTAIAKTHEAAFEGLNVDGLLRWANQRGKWWVKPPSGRFETIEDIEGSLIAGAPDEVVEQVAKFEAVGVEHLVFDFRLRFEEWFNSIELLGTKVLPQLHRA